jgi:hypothetical protein
MSRRMDHNTDHCVISLEGKEKKLTGIIDFRMVENSSA